VTVGGSAALTAPFWAAAAGHRLVRPVCDRCGRSFFVPSWACPFCGSEAWTYRESAGTGTVYSLTIVGRGPDETWTTPYVLAIVDLSEGWSMLTCLDVPAEGADPDALIGAPVSVRFRPEGRPPHRTLPVFAP
jgi:uncharacterized OB-fold protein